MKRGAVLFSRKAFFYVPVCIIEKTSKKKTVILEESI